MSPESLENPFVGPRPFEVGEPLFGRQREIRELSHQLVPERLVLLYSPSGAGKTSLIQAGLLPELREQGFYDLPIARMDFDSVDAPDSANRYVLSLLRSLEQAFPEPLPLEALARSDIGTYLDFRQEELGNQSSLLLVLDQFEDIVTLDPTDLEAKKEFFRQLGRALDHPRRWALFSMREDFVPALDPYLRQLPTRLRTRYRLDLLSPQGARAAIQGPARRMGCEISDAAADALADDLRRLKIQTLERRIETALGPSIEPVQLQVVCFRWWRDEGANIDRLERWSPDAGGDVDSALRSFYEENLRKACVIGGCTERSMRRWVEDHLISPSGLRVLVPDADADKMVPEPAREHLVNNHLVRLERRTGILNLELAHDRLVAPIRSSNAEWFEQHRSKLEKHALLWEQEGRPASLLLRGEALKEARGQLEKVADREMAGPSRDLLSLSEELSRRSSQRWSLLAVSTLGVFLSILSGLFLKTQGALTEARSRELATYAFMKADEDLGLAALLASESSLRSDSHQAKSVLLSVFEQAPRLVTELWSLEGSALALSFSTDRAELQIASSRGLGGWSTTTWHPLVSRTESRDSSIWKVAFDSTGKRMALLSSGGKVEVKACDGYESIASFQLPKDFEVRGLAFAVAENHLLFFGSLREENWLDGRQAEIILWSLETQSPIYRWNRLSSWEVSAAVFAPDGSRFALGFSNGSIQLRDGASGRLLDEFGDHAAPVTALRFHPGGDILASASEDWTVRIWRLDLEKRWSQMLVRHDAGVMALAFDPSGRYLASGSRDTTARLWDLEQQKQIAVLEGHRNQIFEVAFDPAGERVATGSLDGQVLIWQVKDPHPPLGELRNEASTLAFDAQGENLKVLTERGRIESWVLPERKPRSEPRQLVGANQVHSWLRNSSGHLFTISRPRFGLWESSTITIGQYEPVRSMVRLPKGVDMSAAALAAPDEGVLIADPEGGLHRFDLTTGHLLESQLRAHSSAICALAVSPTSPLLASSDVEGRLKLWRIDSFEEMPIRGWEAVTSGPDLCRLAIAPHGRVLAAADGLGTLTFWDIHPRRGARLRARIPNAMPDSRNSLISSLAFDRDGELLAVGGYKDLLLWDVEKHRQVGPSLRAHENRITDLAFSPTEPLLASSSSDRVMLWDLDVEHWRERACRLANRNLSHSEWRQYVGEDEPYRAQCPGYPVPEN